MKNKTQLWVLYVQAKEWVVRPSQLLGISDLYVAYCLDEACFTFGSYITGELEKVEGKKQKDVETKRKRLLKALLSDNPDARFATPVATR